MLIKIQKGENVWTSEGFHKVDERGFAVVAEEEMEIEVSDSCADAVLEIIKSDRQIKGLDPETGLELPKQEEQA